LDGSRVEQLLQGWRDCAVINVLKLADQNGVNLITALEMLSAGCKQRAGEPRR
jgi:hypothetical protein